MSVYTPVSNEALAELLERYDIGDLVALEGIAAGVENSNFKLKTTQKTYILTLFEQHTIAELNYFLALMAFFTQAKFPTASPIADKKGQVLQQIHAKPCAIIEFLSGTTLQQPNTAQCAVIGKTLAQLHLAGEAFPLYRASDRGHDWRMATAQRLKSHLPRQEQQLLAHEMQCQQAIPFAQLPQGVIHADLFCDNVLFAGDQLQGIIDWYYACTDSWLYDLAIVANDWCSHLEGSLDEARLRALLAAYHEHRPLNVMESDHWESMLRGAALRFWLSRLQAILEPRKGAMILQKDPQEFRDRLLQRQKESALIRTCWPD
ncbi:MAG: homoserine kinase [Proteobacteria bacterium]|nr:MAG: homoserine kinase [Pseudomonadota bacterium]